MSYLIYSFGAAVAFAVSQIINKLLSKHSIDNKDSLMAYFMMSSSLFALLLFPFVRFTIPPIEVFKLVIAATSFFLLGYYLFYNGVFTADASTFAPLFQLQSGLIAIFAFIFLGERFPLENYFWMLLMMVGTLFVTYQENLSIKKFFTKGVLFIVGMQVMHSISNIFVALSLKTLTPAEFLFWQNIPLTFLLGVFLFIKKPKINYPVKIVWPMFASGIIVGFGVLGLFKAFTQNLTLSSIIGLLSGPIVFVFSLLASKFSPTFLENHSNKVYLIRGIGLLIILLSAIKITTT